MKQFVFRVKNSTNGKTSILINAKSLDEALAKLDAMGYRPCDHPGKTTYVSREYWNNKYDELGAEFEQAALETNENLEQS